MPDVTPDRFLADLNVSNLLTVEQQEIVLGEFASKDGEPLSQLVNRLIERGWITHWHAQMLHSGRHAFFLKKYKLLQPLGKGGMGSVFMAEDTILQRTVAIKVMRKSLLKSDEAVARFHREIQAAASLSHPNIVAALDANSVAERQFLVMEFVPGNDLSALGKERGRFPIGEACEYVRQAAVGLEHVHQRGMVHRDIKPSNLLLTRGRDGQAVVKILDMGLARIRVDADSEQTELTHTGQLIGTPDYISPEQARDTRTADIRSDIYSLGCSLYRMLTGNPPFDGSSAIGKITARLTEDPPLLRDALPAAPAELEAVLLKMMQRDPDARYQSPAEVVQALSPFAVAPIVESRERETAKPTPIAPQSAPTAVFEPVLSDFLNQLADDAERDEEFDTSLQESDRTLTYVSQQVSGGSASSEVSTQDNASSPAGSQPVDTGSTAQISRAGQKLLNEIADRKRNDKRRLLIVLSAVLLFIAVVAGLLAWQKAGETLLIVDWPLNERQQASIKVDGRNVELTKQARLRLSGPPGRRSVRLVRSGYKPIETTLEFPRGATKSFRPKWQPTPATARQLTIARLTRHVNRWANKSQGSQPNPEDAAVIAFRDSLFEFRVAHRDTAEAADASSLLSRLFWPIDKLNRVEIDSYELEVAGHGEPTNAPPELVAILGDSRLKHWGRVEAAVFTPDGKTIVSCGRDHSISLWDRTTGRRIKLLSGHAREVRTVVVSADGAIIASGSIDGTFKIWDVASGEEVRTFDKHPGQVRAVDFSPDGSKVAASYMDGAIRLWDAGTGQLLHAFNSERESVGVFSVAFSPDGKLLAAPAPDKKIHLYDCSTGEVRNELASGGSCLSFSPDGKLLATSAGDTSVQIWNLDTAEQMHRLYGSASGVTSTAFSPDGRELVGSERGGRVLLWSLADGELIDFSDRHSKTVSAVTVSPDGATICSASMDGTIGLWNAATGELRQTIDNLVDGHPHLSHPFKTVEYDVSGTRILAGSFYSVHLLDGKTGEQEFCIFHDHPHLGHTSATFNHDGQTASFADNSGQLGRWELTTGHIGRLFHPKENGILGIACRPDGKQLATGYQDGSVVLWQLPDLKQQRILPAYHVEAWCVAYSPDGRLLATGGNHTADDSFGVILWDPLTGHKRRILEGHTRSIQSVDFSPDGRTIASAALDGTVRVTNVADGKLQQSIRLAPGGTISQVRFTPDGRHLVTANGNGTLYVLRLKEWSAK